MRRSGRLASLRTRVGGAVLVIMTVSSLIVADPGPAFAALKIKPGPISLFGPSTYSGSFGVGQVVTLTASATFSPPQPYEYGDPQVMAAPPGASPQTIQSSDICYGAATCTVHATFLLTDNGAYSVRFAWACEALACGVTAQSKPVTFRVSGLPQPVFTKQQKADLARAAAAMTNAAIIIGVAGLLVAGGILIVGSGGLAGAGVGLMFGVLGGGAAALFANYLSQLSMADPPDSNFTSIATPKPPSLGRVKAGGQLSAGEAAQVDRSLAVDEEAIGLLGALTTSVNRVQGAQEANSTIWVQRQLAAVKRYATELYPVVLEQASVRAATLKLLEGDKFPLPAISPQVAAKAWQTIENGGAFSPSVVNYLSSIGLGQGFIGYLEDQAQALSPGAAVGSLLSQYLPSNPGGDLVSVLAGANYNFADLGAITSDKKSAWALSEDLPLPGHLTQIDESTGLVTRVLSSPAFGFVSSDSVSADGVHTWVLNQRLYKPGGSVTEIDAATGSLVRVISGNSYHLTMPVSISSDGSHVWVADTPVNPTDHQPNAFSVTEIDAATGLPVRDIPLPGATEVQGGQSVFSDGEDVWVAECGANAVAEIDAATGAVIRVLSGPAFQFDCPVAVTSDRKDVWVANDNTINEVDTVTGKLVDVVTGISGTKSISADGKSVWVCGPEGTVAEIDETTGALVQIVQGGAYQFNQPSGISSDGAHVWVANGSSDTVTEMTAADPSQAEFAALAHELQEIAAPN